MIETIIDAVLISPHDDDVPFSLGGALLDARFDKGIIVTLFSVSKCTIDDREDDVDCVTQIRKAENQQFYCALGSKIRLINSDRLDAPLRLGIREEDVFNTELSGSEDERREAEQLRQTLELMKPKRGVLFAPLGLGEHVDHLLVQAGSGAMTFGAPSSPGVPRDFTKHTILLPYNSTEMVKNAFRKYSDKIAAVIVEPVAGNMGVVLPEPEFLKTLRRLCTKNGSLLIFDEVITGFRIKYGCVQDVFAVKADLTCLGKIIGGGFPIGACGGRAKFMNQLSPQGKVYQAGTLSGNPVCVAAGIATLKLLKSLNRYPALAKETEKLCNRIGRKLKEKNVEHTINRIASMFTVFFNPGQVTDYDSAAKSDTKKYSKYFTAMLKSGIYLPPSQFEACFISTEHKQKDFDKTVTAIGKVKP